MSAVSFTRHAGGYTVRFPFNREVVDLLKAAVPQCYRSWHPSRKVWEIDAIAAAGLADALRECGHTVLGLDNPTPQPAHPGSQWARVLFDRVGPARSTAVYRSLSRVLHPDTPTGDKHLQQELNDAHAAATRGGKQ